MNRFLRIVSVLIVASALFAAITRAEEDAPYSCCGSTTPQPCRYVDGKQACGFDPECTDANFPYCCVDACFRPGG